MKTYFTALSLIFWTQAAMAGDPGRLLELRCGVPNTFIGFSVTLDPSTFDPGSGLYRTENAAVNYEYSGASLLCGGFEPSHLSCVGYWDAYSESPRDIAEVRTVYNAETDTIFATFTTSVPYGKRSVSIRCSVIPARGEGQ